MTHTAGTTPKRRLGLLVLLAALALTLTATPALAADPPLLAKFGQNCGDPVKVGNGCGDEAGETNIPLTLATDPATGHLFVQEVGNRRIDEFDAWGTFVRAWGWGVRDGSAELQTCTAQSGCQEGLTGDGPGQFGGGGGGLAVGSEGAVYVVDPGNRRVQKFSVPEDPDEAVGFDLMFGGEVNKTTNADLCTAASGDTCGIGIAGNPGPGEGQFGTWGFAGSFIAIGPGLPETVFVGDQERIQKFDASGVFKAQLRAARTGLGRLPGVRPLERRPVLRLPGHQNRLFPSGEAAERLPP